MANEQYYPNFNESSWHRSCKQEVVEPICGKVSGTIPKWLNGVLLRNGPGLFEFGDTAVNHLFDGMALLHRFEIKNGMATYQCRFLQSETYTKNKAANRIVVTDFATTSVPDPCQTIFHKISSAFNLKTEVPDNATISIYPFGDEVYSFSETGIIYKVSQENLETKEKIDFAKSLGIVTHSSHPHVLHNGTVYNLALSISKKGPVYHVVCFPNKPKKDMDDYSMFDKAYILGSVPARKKLSPSYMHTFGITENYFIIVEQPFSIEVSRIISLKLLKKPAYHLLKWNGNETTKINVISRHTGKLEYTFYSKGFFYFHMINQYEHLNHIVLDICVFKDAAVFDALYIEAMQNSLKNPNYSEMIQSTPQRFVLPLVEKSDHIPINKNLTQLPNTTSKAYVKKNGRIFVEPEQIGDSICDMPSIYYKEFSGKKYQYFYGISPCTIPVNPGAIIKVDVENKISWAWSEKGCYPSEPVFVPSPNSECEDDGVVLSAVVYENENSAGLIVLDAKTFKEIGRVTFQTPSPAPRSFHGWYFPNP